MTQIEQFMALLPVFAAEVTTPISQLKLSQTEADQDLYHEAYYNLEWYDLTVGWALAKGLPPADAIDFAIYVRYHTQLA